MARTLCLVMIVKNSGNDIINVLRAIKPYINGYVISDTGSIDRTKEFIRQELEGIPGILRDDEWEGFSINRNIVIEHAERYFNHDFYIMLDDSYILHGGQKLLEDLQNFPLGESNNFLLRIFNQERYYYSARIFTKGQRYEFRVHEVFTKLAFGMVSPEVFIEDRISMLHHTRSNQRYSTDIDLLLLDHKEDPENPRHVYYLGRTYYVLDKPKEASEYFRKRISMVDGKDNVGSHYEIYNSMFYLAIIAYRFFLVSKKTETFEIAVDSFKKCHETFPHRAEPLYYQALIMSHFEYEKRKDQIISTLEKAIELPISSDNDIYFDIYEFKIPYMLAFHYYKNKQFEKSLKVIERNYHPEQSVNLRYDNLLIGMKAIKPYKVDHYSDPVIVIYTGNAVPLPWNGAHFNHLCSGSEHMAVRLGEYFSKSGKQVHLFCECTGLDGLVNGIVYHPYQEYYPFIRSNYVDALIVSREADKLSYLKHIRNVFLWIHDVNPIGDEFQTGPCFRGLIALSEWHKQAILRSFPMPEQYIKVIGNSFTPQKELLKQPKKPLQCIYTSSPDRGLDIMIKIILKAAKTLPDITLLIYANESMISPESIQKIQMYPERFTLRPRTDNQTIQLAFAESDYWVYPTGFTETYCITALEAQYYQCVCITTGMGSLSEIVGQRGILLAEKPDSQEIIGETVKKLEFMERNPSLKDMYRGKGLEWAEKQVIEEVGRKWEKLIQY